MSLQGVLADFGLADVFQLISQQRKSGTLEVTREGQVIAVDFFEGAVHAAAPASDRPDHALGEFLVQSGALSEPALEQAFRQQARTLEPLRQVLDSSGQLSRADFDEVEALLTRETLFGLFGWEDGSFRFRAQPLAAAPEAALLSTEAVLLDTLRMRDEWPGLARKLPDGSLRAITLVSIEEFHDRKAPLAAETGISAERLERLFTAAEARLPARRVIALSRLGTFSGTRALCAMVEASLLRLDSAEPEASRQAPPAARKRRGFAAGVIGVAAVVVLLMAQLPDIRREDHPIPADVLREAGPWRAEEQIRLELEAHRWRTGQYPATLDHLGRGARARLAGHGRGQYIYSRSPGGYGLSRTLR